MTEEKTAYDLSGVPSQVDSICTLCGQVARALKSVKSDDDILALAWCCRGHVIATHTSKDGTIREVQLYDFFAPGSICLDDVVADA